MSNPFIINKYTTREQLMEWYGVKKDKFRTMCRRAGVPDRVDLSPMDISRIIKVNGLADFEAEICIPIDVNWAIGQSA